MSQFYYYAIYKPYGILSQFSSEGNREGLASILTGIPKSVYPIGRLDADSEGLLLLSNDNFFKTQLLDPQNQHPRTYWVQVEGTPRESDLETLRNGVEIRIRKKIYLTKPVQATFLPESPLAPRDPPIRYRANIPTTWLSLILKEGKNRQIRRMTAKIGFPTLRLFRRAIGDFRIEGWLPGEMKQIDRQVAYHKILGSQ